MRLPLEIRYMIYRILLARLFPGRHLHLPRSAITGGVRFVVNDSPYSPSRPEGDCFYDLRVLGRPGDRTLVEDDSISTNDDLSLRSSGFLFLSDRSEEEGSSCCSGSVSSSEEADVKYDEYDTDGEIRPRPISNMDSIALLHQNAAAAVSVTIPRVMDPDPECNPRWHEPDYDFYLFEDPAGPYPHEENLVGDMDDCKCYYRSPDDYRAISELSRVSPRFTAELGSVLWADATIEILEPAVFGALVCTRPAALDFVTGVVLHLAFYGDFCDTQVEVVRGVCNFFNGASAAAAGNDPRERKLRSFTVVLSMDKPLTSSGGTTTSTSATMGGAGDDAAYSFGATAETRMAELGAVFRTLEMGDGASFHVRFGRGLPPTFPTWNDRGTRDLRAVMGRITGDIKEAWMPTCIVREQNKIPGRRA